MIIRPRPYNPLIVLWVFCSAVFILDHAAVYFAPPAAGSAYLTIIVGGVKNPKNGLFPDTKSHVCGPDLERRTAKGLWVK